MAFVHGLSAKFYYHNLDFSPFVDEVDPSFERDMAEAAPLSAEWKTVLGGHRTCTISLSGIYDATADKIEAQAWARFDGSTDRVWAYLPRGDTLAYACYCGECRFGDEKITAGDDIVKLPFTVIGTDRADRATVIHALGEETSAGEGASQDGSAASVLGCRAYLICTALDATTLDVKLEDSANDVDWDDLVEFTQLSAVGSEMKEVAAAAGTPDQYVRVSWTPTGGNTTATFFVAWYRI